MTTILIDADACPVVNETIRIAEYFGFRVYPYLRYCT